MLIKLDTGIMYEMANCAKIACQYVEESSEIAYRIVPHDDWNCQERDHINEGIQIIRRFQARIGGKITQFADAISQVATAFLDAEAALPNLFNEVDACVGEMLSVVGSNVSNIGSQTQQILDQVKATSFDDDGLQNFAATVIDSSLQVCDFSAIDLEGGNG